MNDEVPELRAASTDSWRKVVIDSALDAVIRMDNQGLIIDWNRSVEVIFGWEKSRALGRKLADLIIPPEYRSAHVKSLQYFLDISEGPLLNQRIEVEGLHRNGGIFPLELTVIPIRIGSAVFFTVSPAIFLSGERSTIF